ncbi:hypothetical protein Dimus_019729 [Dionaea muscipula]
MASSLRSLLFISSLCYFLVSSSSHAAVAAFLPKALVVPLSKDASTLQYTTIIHQRTPLVPVKLVLDLAGQFLWVDCDKNYLSSSYRPARCRSPQCSLAWSSSCGSCFSAPRPGCNNNTCGLFPDNTITNTGSGGELGSDVVSLQSTDGSSSGQAVTVPHLLFSCAPSFLLEGHAAGTTGIVGLGRAEFGLPTQFAAAFSFPKQFAICIPSTGRGTTQGVAFFGPGPYNLLPNVVASNLLSYTPLLRNPVSTAAAFSQGEPSTEYFIGVKSIQIIDKTVLLNQSLLKIDGRGNGGTKISTVNPYTVMEESIFKAFTGAYAAAAAGGFNMTRVAAVEPFEVCFSAKNMHPTRLGFAVPMVSLVLQGESMLWRITGSNLMVQVSDEVLCLGFVNGGVSPRTAIIIGGFQLEDNLLQIDLVTSRLGFTDTLLGSETTCANFNFTSMA